MSKLIAWKTPFATAEWPSVWVALKRALRGATFYVDADQLWQIRFSYVAGLKVCDESYDDNTRFHIEGGEKNLCSYLWEDSPWMAEFNTEQIEAVESGKLTHYVLLGGDYNIEILALGDVTISPADV